MSYVENNLNNNEEIKYLGKLHWIVFVYPMFFSLLMLTIISYTLSYVVHLPYVNLAYIGLFTIAIIYGFIDKFTTEIVITNQRLIKKVGLFERNVQELNLSKIETIDLHQSIMGRIWNYGSLNFIGTGSSFFNILGVINPNEFKNELNNAIEEKNRKN